MFKNIKASRCIIAVLSSMFVAFGLYQVHSLSGVTEGGVLGLNLLLEHWLNITPAITNFVATALCYLLGWKLLGREFIIYSAFAIGSFSVSYRIFEQFDRLWPQLYNMPLAAALLGAVFVGVGTGVCIRAGAAICGDDALAVGISHHRCHSAGFVGYIYPLQPSVVFHTHGGAFGTDNRFYPAHRHKEKRKGV